MLIEDSFAVTAPQREVWEILQDIPRVSACTPGVEQVEEIGPDRYQGMLKVKVGPIKAAFSGQVTILERSEPDHLSAQIEGMDRSSASNVKATFNAHLKTVGETTQVDYAMDVGLRGRLAQFGTAVIRGTAKKFVQDFAKCLQGELDGKAGEAQAEEA